MNRDVFFGFDSKYPSASIQAHAIGLKSDEYNMHDCSKLIKKNFENIKFPVVFKQEYGKKLTDILGTGWPSLYLISTRMKTILEIEQLTGWTTFPIKLYDKKSNEIIEYHGFSITGKCASIDYKKSEIIEKRLVPDGPLCSFYKGISIDDWDGSDFFTPDKYYGIFITNKAACILKKNKITNMSLKDICDFEIDVS